MAASDPRWGPPERLFVAPMTTVPPREPAAASTSATAVEGTASTTASFAAAVLAIVSRVETVTAWPAERQRVARAPPTLPPPRIPIFIRSSFLLTTEDGRVAAGLLGMTI